MAEQVIIVCDYCGKPAADTAAVKLNGSSWQLDLCAAHVAELKDAAHKPHRGHRRGQYATR